MPHKNTNTALITPEEHYTPQQVGAACHVESRTVCRWAADGLIKAVKIGRRYLIPRAEVERLLGRVA